MLNESVDWSNVNWEVAGASIAERAYNLAKAVRRGESSFYDELHRGILRVRRALNLDNRKRQQVNDSQTELIVLLFLGFSYLANAYLRICKNDNDTRIACMKTFANLSCIAREFGFASFSLFVETYDEMQAYIDQSIDVIWDAEHICFELAELLFNSWLNSLIEREASTDPEIAILVAGLAERERDVEEIAELMAALFLGLSSSLKEQVEKCTIDKCGPSVISG